MIRFNVIDLYERNLTDEVLQYGAEYIKHRQCGHVGGRIFGDHALLHFLKCRSLEKTVSELFRMAEYHS